MWIISDDSVFAEALEITLREAGISADILSALPARPYDTDGWIIDLDTVSLSAIPSSAITFTRFPAAHPEADLMRPFLFREMIALVKERFALSAPLPVLQTPIATAPFLKLLPDGVLMQGKKISLSPAEREVLALLMENIGECVAKEQIDALWQEKGGNTTAVYIRYLRQKLDEPSGLRLIQSVRGRGYCLCLPS